MPAYNVGNYISESIDSILNQTFADFELLVIDDCSTDNTAEIVNAYTDARIRYVKNEHNLGLAENLNKGIQLANTEYIARMDGDDISVSTCLEKQIQYLDNHPDVGICGVGFQFFGTRTSTVIYPEYFEEVKVRMLFGCTVILPMFHKSVFVENNLKYKTSAFPAEDYMIWAECLRVTKIYNLQEVLFYYRMHESQISTSRRAAQIIKTNEVRLFMLEYLSADFSESEKLYFLDVFVPGKMESIVEFDHLQDFARLLETKANTNFDHNALHTYLQNHLKKIMYSFALDRYFKNGFSLKSFFLYLASKCVRVVPIKLTAKIFAKSVLSRK
jgi:glycosyltransferase involved in cell wall biosynthesis